MKKDEKSRLDLQRVFREGRTDFEEAMRIGRMSPDEVISSTCDWLMVLATGFIKAWRSEGKTYPEAEVLFRALLRDHIVDPVINQVIEAGINLENRVPSFISDKKELPN